MGTVVEITVAHRSEAEARAAIAAGMSEIARIDRLLSSYDPDSLISRINRDAFRKPVVVTEEILDLLQAAVSTSRESEGAFDITVGPVTRLWGFESGGHVPEDDILASAVDKVGYENLIVDRESISVGFKVEGMAIDLGGIGKRWAVDRTADLLKQRGVRSAIIDIGGDLRVMGSRPGKDHWRIAVQDPRIPGKALASFDLKDAAVVTSGDYERFFIEGGTRYHHLLVPTTGQPARECRSVTVLAQTAMEACATAAFVLGPERGLAYLRRQPGVRGLIVDARGVLHWTDPELERSARR